MSAQIIPPNPSFLNQLAQVIPQALGNIGQGYLQGKQNLADQNILNQLSQNPDISPLQMVQAFSSLSQGKQQAISPLFTHIIDLQRGQLAQKQKQEMAAQAQEQEKEEVGTVINDLADELMKGKLGKLNFLNRLTSKGRESRAYFDELALAIEKRLAGMVGKGTLSKERFNYLKKNLPASGDTDATNRGRLRALAKEFGTEIKNPEFQAASEKAQGSSERARKNVEAHDRPLLRDIFK